MTSLVAQLVGHAVKCENLNRDFHFFGTRLPSWKWKTDTT